MLHFASYKQANQFKRSCDSGLYPNFRVLAFEGNDNKETGDKRFRTSFVKIRTTDLMEDLNKIKRDKGGLNKHYLYKDNFYGVIIRNISSKITVDNLKTH